MRAFKVRSLLRYFLVGAAVIGAGTTLAMPAHAMVVRCKRPQNVPQQESSIQLQRTYNGQPIGDPVTVYEDKQTAPSHAPVDTNQDRYKRCYPSPSYGRGNPPPVYR